MANDLERITIALEARTKSLETALNRANGIADKRARAIETRFARMSKSIEGSFSKLGAGAGRAFALIGGVAGLKSLTDSATKIDNALKVTGLSGEELTKVYDKLFESAQKNSAPLEGLVTLYSRVALAQKDLGVTSEQIVSLTDNVGKALLLSGSSAAESSGALLQLSQALGGGVLQAEEYNSLIDGLPGLLQAAAAGIKEAGGSVSALTRLVKDGKVTSKAFFDGIQAGAPLLDQKLASSVQTIDQKMVNLGNSLLDAAHRFNSSSTAASTFGKEIDRTASYISKVNFETLISEITKVITAFDNAVLAVNRFFTSAGQSTGFDGIGADVVNLLGGEGGKATFFGGGLTVSSTKIIQDRISGAFADVDQQVTDLTAQAIVDSAKRNNLGPKADPKGTRLPVAAAIDPITLADYKVPAKDKKGGKAKTDDYARETDQIKQRTASTIAETEAQALLNPLIDDYGFAVAKASAKQDLLNAAKEAGKAVTPQMAADIEALAEAYARASAEADRLSQSQDLIRQRSEEMRDLQKDLARGLVQGFIEGKDAAELLSDALGKIGDKLLDMAIDGIFEPTSKGGLGLDLFSSLKGIFREKGGPVKKGQPYIVGEKRPEVFVPDQSGTIMPSVPSASAPVMPKISSATTKNTGPNITYSPSYDARGADVAAVARLEQAMARDRQAFSTNVLTTMRKAKATRNWK
jgi:tape measure domain-containing protein